jgi:NAD-dependent SIR2 family protein deacetylase
MIGEENQLANDCRLLKKLLQTRKRIVVITGAGISVNAG